MEKKNLIKSCAMHAPFNIAPMDCEYCLNSTLTRMLEEIVAMRNELDNLKKEHKEHTHYYWDAAGYYTTTQTPDYIPDPY